LVSFLGSGFGPDQKDRKKNEERNGIVYGIRIVRVKLAGVAIAEIPLIAGAP